MCCNSCIIHIVVSEERASFGLVEGYQEHPMEAGPMTPKDNARTPRDTQPGEPCSQGTRKLSNCYSDKKAGWSYYSTAKTPMATKLLWRQSLRSAKLRPASSQAKVYFSSSTGLAQEGSKTEQSNHERYTHFGYENVREEEKASKGMIPLHK